MAILHQTSSHSTFSDALYQGLLPKRDLRTKADDIEKQGLNRKGRNFMVKTKRGCATGLDSLGKN